MRRKWLFILLLFPLFSVNSLAWNSQTPEQVTESFYNWYLEKVAIESLPPIPNDNVQSLRDEKARTARFLSKNLSSRLNKWLKSREYQNWGADYFLDSQDWDENWQIKVSRVFLKNNSARVKVVLFVPKGKEVKLGDQTLLLNFVRESGLWKIDRINEK